MNKIKIKEIENKDIIDLLLFENKILRKKINKEKLTDEEIIFDYMLPPSFSIRILKRLKKRGKI